MYPASTEFKRAVRGSHHAVFAAEVWSDDVKLLDLDVLDGSVSVDSRRAVRRTFNVNLTSPDPITRTARATAGTYAELATDYATYTLLTAGVGSYGVLTYAGDVVTVSEDIGIVPDDAFDALAPFGNEVRLWRGITVDKESSITYADIAGTCAADTYRTNLCTNPSAEVSAWSRAGIGGTVTRDTGRFFIGSASTKYVWTADYGGLQSPVLTVAPLTTYTVSIYVYVETGASPTFRVSASDYTTNIQTLTGTPVVGQWVRLSKTFTTTAGQTDLRVWNGETVSASTYYVDACLVEQSATLGTYFDGTTDPRSSWTGTAHASTSRLKTSWRTNLATNPSAEVDVSTWSAYGGGVSIFSRSTAQKYVGSASYILDGAVASGANKGINSSAPLSVVPLAPLTLSGYYYRQAGTATWKIILEYFTAAGAYISEVSTSTANTTTGVWQRISVTGTPPANCTGVKISFASTSIAAADVVYLDAILLEQSSSLGDYFDGSIEGGGGVWSGTAHASSSTVRSDMTGTYYDLYLDYATYGVLAQSFSSYSEAEMIPLGVFLLTDVEINTGDGGVQIQASGSDRSLRISRARWTQPYTIPTGTNLADAIQGLLEDRWVDVQCRFTSTTETINKAVFGTESDNDPWRDAQGIAKSAGYELYFDADGYAVLDSITDASTASPNATYSENEEAMVLKLTRSLSNEQTYNGVIVTAEGTEASDTFREEAWDDDPASPTYRYGKFGQAPFFFSSPLITTAAAAQSAASGLLNSKKGATENVQWTQIVDPSLDAGDLVAVTNSDAKVDRLMVLDRITIPLDATGTMSAVARTVRSLNGETFEDVA
jgi:hypothetical protein